MLQLVHFKHTSIVVPYKHQIHLIFMNKPIRHEEWLDALNMSSAKDEWHINQFYLALIEGEACHIMGCINTYLKSPICSIHFLACKTSSHQVAWWKYRQVDLRCPHSQCKYPLFVDDLLWNSDDHQCALFLHVEPDCWWAWFTLIVT